MKLRISLLIILMSMLFTSCGISTGKGTEQKEEEISVLRYDKLLSEYVRSNSFSAMQKLTMDYRMPTKILIEDVLSIGPFIYSQVSAFNESIILVDSLLGISLDKYMGEDYPLYKRFYYDYQCRSMRPERIVPDCFAFYLLSRYGMNYHEGTCLIDLMMHTGKINYVVQNLLGYSDIGEAMGYSKEESDWCKDNEKEIWNYICTNDHLHARDPMVIRYYMKPAPAVDMLGAQAPALIGTWMGARIIASYMKKHKDMKLKDLLEFTDYHEMLSESNYLAS